MISWIIRTPYFYKGDCFEVEFNCSQEFLKGLEVLIETSHAQFNTEKVLSSSFLNFLLIVSQRKRLSLSDLNYKICFHLGRWYYLKGHCQNQKGRILAFQSCFRQTLFNTLTTNVSII